MRHAVSSRRGGGGTSWRWRWWWLLADWLSGAVGVEVLLLIQGRDSLLEGAELGFLGLGVRHDC